MVGEVDGSGIGEHERAIVALVGVGVVGGGEVDARAALERGEERRRDVGPDQTRDAVELLAGALVRILHGRAEILERETTRSKCRERKSLS